MYGQAQGLYKNKDDDNNHAECEFWESSASPRRHTRLFPIGDVACLEAAVLPRVATQPVVTRSSWHAKDQGQYTL